MNKGALVGATVLAKAAVESLGTSYRRCCTRSQRCTRGKRCVSALPAAEMREAAPGRGIDGLQSRTPGALESPWCCREESLLEKNRFRQWLGDKRVLLPHHPPRSCEVC